MFQCRHGQTMASGWPVKVLNPPIELGRNYIEPCFYFSCNSYVSQGLLTFSVLLQFVLYSLTQPLCKDERTQEKESRQRTQEAILLCMYVSFSVGLCKK